MTQSESPLATRLRETLVDADTPLVEQVSTTVESTGYGLALATGGYALGYRQGVPETALMLGQAPPLPGWVTPALAVATVFVAVGVALEPAAERWRGSAENPQA